MFEEENGGENEANTSELAIDNFVRVVRETEPTRSNGGFESIDSPEIPPVEKGRDRE